MYITTQSYELMNCFYFNFQQHNSIMSRQFSYEILFALFEIFHKFLRLSSALNVLVILINP